MRFVTVPAFLFLCLTLVSRQALADTINLGPTNQSVTFTGLGPNSLGQGVNRVTLGSCVFDGVNTTCTLTAPFTGHGGGTVAFVLTYAGNGLSPLTAVVDSFGDLLLAITGSSVSLVQTLTAPNGATTAFYFSSVTQFAFVQPQCTGVPVCNTQTVGLAVNATITGPVTSISDLTPYIRTSQGVISAGSFGAFSAIAPGTWMEIYGNNLGTILNRTWGGGDFNGNNAPTSLAGTSVTVGGLPAFIDYVNQDQVNAQVPSGVPAGPQRVLVTTAGGTSPPYIVTVNPIEPGLLAPPVFQLSAGQYIVALYPDGITYVLPPGVTNAVPTKRAKPGDTILLYGVGFGPVTPTIPAGQIVQQSNSLQSPFQISFAGTPATVTYFGLVPTYVGLYQFNVVVPNIAASDVVPITFSVGTTPINLQTLIIAVGQN